MINVYKLEVKENSLNLLKGPTKKQTSYLRMKCWEISFWNKTKMPSLTICIQHCMRSPWQCNKTRQRKGECFRKKN